MIPNIKHVTAAGVSSDDVYSSEFARRRIYLTQEITPSASADVCAQLLCLAAQGREDIHLIIQSPGGQVTAALAILDTMDLCGCDVNTYVFGEAASAAALLASAGKRRFIAPNAEMMIHQPLGGASGQATDIQIHAEQILRIKRQMNELLAQNTGKPLKAIEKDVERDHFLTAEEAKEYGLIDEIIVPRR